MKHSFFFRVPPPLCRGRAEVSDTSCHGLDASLLEGLRPEELFPDDAPIGVIEELVSSNVNDDFARVGGDRDAPTDKCPAMSLKPAARP